MVEEILKTFTDIIIKAGAGHIRKVGGPGVSKDEKGDNIGMIGNVVKNINYLNNMS